jgi:hypothetical protein
MCGRACAYYVSVDSHVCAVACAYVYVRIHVRVHMYIYVYVHIYVHVPLYGNVCVCAYMYVSC